MRAQTSSIESEKREQGKEREGTDIVHRERGKFARVCVCVYVCVCVCERERGREGEREGDREGADLVNRERGKLSCDGHHRCHNHLLL